MIRLQLPLLIVLFCSTTLWGRSLPKAIETAKPIYSATTTVWGQTGHRVVGYLAESKLSRKARRRINQILDGESLAFVSTFADEIKSDDAFRKYGPWHYINIPLDATYDPTNRSDQGDLAYGIEQCISVLSDPKASRSDLQFHLKLLVHLIGDLHQPFHIGREEDRGGNDIKISWFSSKSNLHRLWDSNLIDSYSMSYRELGDELLSQSSAKQFEMYAKGTYLDWIEDSHQIVAELYSSVKPDERLAYRYSYDYNPVVFEQLKKGGFRLATLLNQIFD